MQTRQTDSMNLSNTETDLLENSRIFLKSQLQVKNRLKKEYIVVTHSKTNKIHS